jgi:HEPN domain-containing protein
MGFSFLSRACNRLDEAKLQLDKNHFPESISASQECIEFSINAIFHFAKVKYPPEHTFEEESFKRVLENIAKCAAERGNLERLYMISTFWSSMYSIAKYGCQKIGVGPEMLFQNKEALFALSHAYEVYEQARNIYYDCCPLRILKTSYVRRTPSPNFTLRFQNVNGRTIAKRALNCGIMD